MTMTKQQQPRDALNDAAVLQQHTLESLRRARERATEAESVGASTLEELQAHRATLDRIEADASRFEEGTKRSEQLQNKLGRWSLRFNRRSARRDVEAERNKANDTMAAPPRQTAKHAKQNTAAGKSKKAGRSANSKHGGKKSRRGDSVPDGPATTAPSSLLDGLNLQPGDEEYTELTQLGTTDLEIDAQLDGVSAQLDTLLRLSSTVQDEVDAQSETLDGVATRVAESTHRQTIVNRRATRFLDGKKRKEHSMQDTLSAGALSRLVLKNAT